MGYKLKRILIYPDGVTEKQVYPNKSINISSDLRGATLAGLQAQGWDGINYRMANYVLDSNGLSPSSTNNDFAFLYKYIDWLSSSNVIEMTVTGYLTKNNTTNSGMIRNIMSSVNTYNDGIFSTSLMCGYKTGTQTNVTQGVIFDTTVLGTPPTGDTAGNVTLYCKIDLSTGAVQYRLTSPKTHSIDTTLTSSQLQSLLTYKYVGFMVQQFNAPNTSRIYTVDLTVK